ncbi:MAG: hypothetical protein JXK16_06310 [Thiotrichales bacterium]|nr:hypothetical protein [Thiotrichales bacterium]
MKKTKLALALTMMSSAALLAACGGGGGGSDSSDSDDSQSPQPSTISGYVADGYLGGATVCIDANQNFACDSDEPRSNTLSDGSYSITAVYAPTDIILVDVPPTAIDADTGQAVGGSGYMLMAAINNAAFISPLSTLVQGHVDSGMTYDQALTKVAQDLGVPVEQRAKIVENFIDYENVEDAALKLKLHKAAILTATVARERLIEFVQANGGQLTSEQRTAALENIIITMMSSAYEIAQRSSLVGIDELRSFNIYNLVKSGSPDSFLGSLQLSDEGGNSSSPFLPAGGTVSYESACYTVASGVHAYTAYDFLANGQLQARNIIYSSNGGRDSLADCEARDDFHSVSGLPAFDYEVPTGFFDEPYSAIMKFSYKASNDYDLYQDVDNYTRAKAENGYLCFGEGEGFIPKDTTDFDEVRDDTGFYGTFRHLGLLGKIDYLFVSPNVETNLLDRCLTRVTK